MKAFLHWINRYVKTDIAYVARGGGSLSLGQFVASVSSFALAVVLAHVLSKEAYGSYQYILSVAGILSVTSLAGINTSLSQSIARGNEGDLSIALREKIQWGLLGGIGALGAGVYYLVNGNIDLAISFFIVGIFFPFVDAFGIYASYLQSKKLFGLSIQYFAASHVFSVAAVIAAGLFTHSLPVMIFAYFASFTLTRYIAFKLSVKRFPPNNRAGEGMLSKAKHLSVVGAFTTVASYLDRMLIFHYLGAAETALYSLAIAPIEQVKALAKNISPLAMPKLAARTFKEIDTMLYKRLRDLAILGALIAGAYFFIAPFFFEIFFPKYPEAVFYSRLFALTIIFRISGNFFGAATQSKLHHIPEGWLYWGILPQAALIVALFILVPMYGIMGVFMAKMASSILASIAGWVNWKMLGKRENVFSSV